MAFRGRKGRGGGNFERDEPNGFRNPQYGPGTKLHDPVWEKEIKRKLEHFKSSDEPELRFKQMENHERKRVHELARRMEMNSTSTGREPFRLVVVTRRRKTDNAIATSTARDTQPIKLSEPQKISIDQFIKTHPITQAEIDRHLEAKYDKKSRHNHGDRKQNMMNDPQIPPSSNASPEMKQSRYHLPAFAKKDCLLKAIEKHDVTLITGGTGCGKTTQVPQFLLEQYHERNVPIRIVCTQPRRLPAIAVAERVARERGERCGQTVGYHIRLEQKTSNNTVLTYCTSGVLLRMLTIDELATGVTHIILDEVHEREQNTDYLLIALKEALDKRKDLKVILMSATMEGNINMFMRYFNKYSIDHLEIESRLFNVQKFFLGDVLAMTGYCPPDSPFGAVGFFDATGSNSTSMAIDEKFPRVESWVCNSGNNFPTQLPESQTAPNLSSFGMASSHQNAPLSNSASTSNLQSQNCGAPDYTNLAMQLARQSVTVEPQSSMQVGFPATGFGQKPIGYTPPSSFGQMGFHQPQQRHQTATPQYQQQLSWPGGEPVADVVDLPCSDEEEMLPGSDHQMHAYAGTSAHQGHSHMQTHSMSFSNSNSQMDWNMQSQQPQQHMGQTSWQHTQSFAGMPAHGQMQQQPALHSWNSGQQTAQYAQNYVQETKPGFYLADSEVNHTAFYGQGMDPYSMQPNFQHPPPSVPPPPQQTQQAIQVHPTRGFNGSGFAPSSFANPPMSEVDRFGNQMREQEAESQRMRQNLTTALRDRPQSFEWKVCNMLENARLDSDCLVNSYMKCGGSQWCDAVDIDLCHVVIDYCMDSSIEGSILVFLPGFDDITNLKEKVQAQKTKKTPLVYTLHSQMNSQDQQKVFEPAPAGYRKVILSTNIAEASLTIDDVVFVIDCGKVKEKTYDHESRISQLKVTWIAKSNAEQRSGRAGRCREGFCFRLYSSGDYNSMLSTQVAEMQRAAIHDVCLHAKMYAPENVSVRDFLDMAPEPPSREAVSNSLQFLEQLGALYNETANKIDPSQVSYLQSAFTRNRREHVEINRDPELTDLGRLIAQLPLEPQLARLLLFGLVLRCFSPILTLVAALSHREPFVIVTGDQRAQSLETRDEFGRRDLSDHLMLIRAYNEFMKQTSGNQGYWCKRKFMAFNTMKMIAGIRRQLVSELKRVNMIKGDCTDTDINKYSNCWPMIQAAIVAGCYPGIGYVRNGNKLRKIRTSYDGAATLHPSSVIKRQIAPRYGDSMKKYGGTGEPQIEYMVFQELARIEEGLTLRCVTIVPPLTVVIFGGAIRLKKATIDCYNIVCDEDVPEIREETDEPSAFESAWVLDLEQWLAVRGSYQELRRVLQLRFHFMSYFLQIMREPQDLYTDAHDQLLEVLSKILCEDHRRFSFNDVADMPEIKGRSFFQQAPVHQPMERDNRQQREGDVRQQRDGDIRQQRDGARDSDARESHNLHSRRIESSSDVRTDRSAHSSYSNNRYHDRTGSNWNRREKFDKYGGRDRDYHGERDYGSRREDEPLWDNVPVPMRTMESESRSSWGRNIIASQNQSREDQQQRPREEHHPREQKKSFFDNNYHRDRDHRPSRNNYNHRNNEYYEEVPDDPPQSSYYDNQDEEHVQVPYFDTDEQEDDWGTPYSQQQQQQPQQQSKTSHYHGNQGGGGGGGKSKFIQWRNKGGGGNKRDDRDRDRNYGNRDRGGGGNNDYESNNAQSYNGSGSGYGRQNNRGGSRGGKFHGGDRGGSDRGNGRNWDSDQGKPHGGRRNQNQNQRN